MTAPSRSPAMRLSAILLVVAALVPASLQGQSIYNSAGLGLPVESLDARTRSLGNVGIGLLGSRVLPSDPAAAALLGIPGAVLTAQPSWVELGRTDTGETGSYQGTRFPLVGISYPAWDFGMATFSFGSVLDQRYSGIRNATVDLEEGPVAVVDSFDVSGGISEVRLGLARPVGSAFQVGVSVGRYTGSTLRTLIRSLDGVSLTGTVSDFQEGGRWEYSGTSVTGGASMNVGQIARLAGSVTWSSELTAQADSEEQEDRTFDLPLELRVGASAMLAPGLLVNASLRRASWGGTGDDLRTGTARDVTAYGAGIELSRARLLGRQAPIRVGYRSADLPFSLNGEPASETAWTGGIGLDLASTGPLVLAGLDLAVEWGERSEIGVVEDFWRGSLTLRVSGL